jgi:hypothetical protein
MTMHVEGGGGYVQQTWGHRRNNFLCFYTTTDGVYLGTDDHAVK